MLVKHPRLTVNRACSLWACAARNPAGPMAVSTALQITMDVLKDRVSVLLRKSKKAVI